MFGFAQPQIPFGMLHDMEHVIRIGAHSSNENGGQWIPGDEQRVRFKGVVLPVSNKDLQYAPAGTFTKNSQKLYTNGYTMEPGARVYDPVDGNTYTVQKELTYGPLHPLKRFAIECKERSVSR